MRLIVLMSGALAIAACAPVEAPAPTDAPQPCDATAARSMIGQNVAAISFPADSNVRVVCTTCPTTRDHRPDRLNVRFNQATGIVESVDCG